MPDSMIVIERPSVGPSPPTTVEFAEGDENSMSLRTKQDRVVKHKSRKLRNSAMWTKIAGRGLLKKIRNKQKTEENAASQLECPQGGRTTSLSPLEQLDHNPMIFRSSKR
jgi:hypothetical protein